MNYDNAFIYVQNILTLYPVFAPIMFVVLQSILAIFFLPCSPMTLIAGALWGWSYGLLISMIGSVVASSITFFLSHTFFKKGIQHWFGYRYPKMLSFLDKVAIYDWKLIAVSQMNPMMPASSLGYFFGLSSLGYFRYIGFSIIFMLPLQLLFILSGGSLSGLFLSEIHPIFTLLGLSFLFLFLAMSRSIYNKLCKRLGVLIED